jgi:hypothetical protein
MQECCDGRIGVHKNYVSDEVAANIYVHFSGVVVLNAVLRLLSSLQRETIP